MRLDIARRLARASRLLDLGLCAHYVRVVVVQAKGIDGNGFNNAQSRL